MDIKSLRNIKINPNTGLYDLFTPTFSGNTNIKLSKYIVEKDDEMRIDLVFKNMYSIDNSNLLPYLEDLDVILYINGIDNPLNIKEGMILDYPSSISDLESFRYTLDVDISDKSITKKLSVQNITTKTTRRDSTRQNYIENDYSLSPVVLDTPREPVRIENGKFSIGGL